MPKSTAVWLIENSTLTFQQIADFCDMHILEVKGIADGDVASSVIGQDPIIASMLTKEEIKRCEEDSSAILHMNQRIEQHLSLKKSKAAKYTPMARRRDKPDAVSWIIKHCPEINDKQIIKLLGTTQHTIDAIRSKEHWNISNIKPRDPVLLGICSQIDLDNTREKAKILAASKSANDALLAGDAHV